jgi:6-phosphogluconate dehydrogenase
VSTTQPMQVGMVGLGRMGANLVRRLLRDGHRCVVYDVNEASIAALEAEGAVGARTLPEFVAALERPRIAWLMLPAGITEATLYELADLCDEGDVMIDGGNSYYRDDITRAAALRPRGLHYVDCGTSGGIFGLERGYCLMIGGETETVRRLEPLWRTIAPGSGDVEPTPDRVARSTADQGFLHCGPAGAGHFVKMVHNGIEYGMMAALAEGLNILDHAGAGLEGRSHDAETAPLRDPEAYQYDFDLGEITELWRRGSVVSSWLVDLTAAAFAKSPTLDNFSGHVSDSGEGRWTVMAAIDESVPAPVITASLFSRYESRGEGNFAARVLSAMRAEFGGHAEKPSA